MFTNLGPLFWKEAGERAVKTAIQVFVALLSVGSVGVLDAPWRAALSTAAMAALLSVLTSVISEPVGQRHTPSVLIIRRSTVRHDRRAKVPAQYLSQLGAGCQVASEIPWSQRTGMITFLRPGDLPPVRWPLPSTPLRRRIRRPGGNPSRSAAAGRAAADASRTSP